MRFLNPERAAREYLAGRTMRDLAEQASVPPGTVRDTLTSTGVAARADAAAGRLRAGTWQPLREKATAAAEQLQRGPREWPGRPSAQRLALFLEASPETILSLLRDLDALTEEFPMDAHD